MKLLISNPAIFGIDGLTLCDFWSWAYSDILSNTNRSVFAEFIVAVALDMHHNPRIEWDSVDLKYREKGIEVKTSAFIQSWSQRRVSTIRFDIAPKRPWDAEKSTFGILQKRSAEIYVFCLLTPTEKAIINPLNITQWEFYVVATKVLERHFKKQKSIGLQKLKNISVSVPYSVLKSVIDEIINSDTNANP